MQTFSQTLPLIILFAAMYFLMIRPQQKQAKERKAMIEALKKGDRVTTIGGMHGTIEEIDEVSVVLKVADGVKIKFNRTAVGMVQK